MRTKRSLESTEVCLYVGNRFHPPDDEARARLQQIKVEDWQRIDRKLVLECPEGPELFHKLGDEGVE